MSQVKSVEFEGDRMNITLTLTKDEYDRLETQHRNLIILPLNNGFFERKLTTGKMGKSNRIMLPEMFLKGHRITKLVRESPSKLFEIDGGKHLDPLSPLDRS